MNDSFMAVRMLESMKAVFLISRRLEIRPIAVCIWVIMHQSIIMWWSVGCMFTQESGERLQQFAYANAKHIKIHAFNTMVQYDTICYARNDNANIEHATPFQMQ